MNTNLNIIISKSLEYYDRNLELNNKKYFNKTNNYKINNNKFNRDTIDFYYNKKKLFSFKMEEIGLYDTKTNIWIWSWAISKNSKKNNDISRKILNYGLDLADDSLISLKNELITSRYKIKNELQLDIKIALCSYLSKIPIIFEIKEYKLKKYFFLFNEE
jgi:hypothetical protein